MTVQSPSSLIFLVLLGVWAAYFVQYWVRRRDHVATARSVEQFSTALRVLERRDALPRTDLSEPAPRSYAVHPARAARPQVIVKRALAAEPPAPSTVTERIGRPAATHRPTGPGLRPSRRVRGLLLLLAVAGLAAVVLLVTASVLPAWSLVPALLTSGAALAFVRSGVRTEAALARAHRRRRAVDLARPRTAVPLGGPAPIASRAPVTRATAGVARRHPAPVVPDEAFDVDRPGFAAPSPASAPAPVAVASALDEGVAATQSPPVEAAVVPAPERAPRPPLLDPVLEVSAPAPVAAPARVAAPDVMVPIEVEDDIPLTWDPVPVPRPTYTMKARAERPAVLPAAVTPDPAPVVGGADDSRFDARRVAGA